MEQISFQYPAWWLILCLALGAGGAALLYFRDQTFQEQPTWVRWLMAAVRTIVIALIAALLLSPLIKSLNTEVKKPIVLVAQDNSESIAAEMTDEQREQYKLAMEQLQDKLGNDYELKAYSFGDEVREGIDFSYTDKVSNISQFLKEVYDLYSNQNLGAVILASDGIYNEGSNPVYSGNQLGIPVFTVALGDTTPKKDLALRRVFHNKIAYLGDKFSVQVDISALNCAGANSVLSVYKVDGGSARKLQDIPFAIGTNDFFTTQEIVLDADKAGVQRFRVAVQSLSGEATTLNNAKEIFIDVLDARQKILILANAPHPDLSALKQALTTSKNYQVDIRYINGFTGNLADYDVLILHQLPGLNNDATGILNQIQTKNIPTLFIVGAQTNLSLLNRVQPLVTIQASGPGNNEVQGLVAPDFNLFTVSEDLRKIISRFPPLVAPFADFAASGTGQPLLFQRIGRIDTRYPLIVLGSPNNTRMGVICAEGIWKWRLYDFLDNQNHDLSNELIGKIIQYVGLKEDKRRFRVSLPKSIFNENEPVILDAELYNENYELVNDPDATITIRDEEGKEYNSTFNKAGNAYTLSAGILPVGNYTFQAFANSSGQQLTFSGQFSVQPIQLELFETTADHGMLRLLSEQFDGKMVYPDQIGALPDLISSKNSVKEVIYSSTKTRAAINLKWLFFLLLFLLTVEWFLRRYLGAY
ncbi:MAG: VWA domain-containing protein [Lewinellaceae bacterium]|nr:VWA domain-containing protein [Lewinella sp.]MCB9281731.1 VWA domain-containing protein [Lewinellaceae bacterium]